MLVAWCLLLVGFLVLINPTYYAKIITFESLLLRRFFISMSVSKYDNAFKQKVLLKEIDKQVARCKRDNYKKVSTTYYIDEEDGEVLYSLSCDSYRKMIAPYRKGYNLIDCADRLNESKYRRAKKVRDKITKLVLSNNAIFITLTFNDKTLSKTDTDKRRRLVQRYLKANCKEYVANIDFGGLNGREHYHAIVSKELVLQNWFKYGSIDIERVRPFDNSYKRLSRYITKLTNHALKVGAIAPRLIYSRNTL